MLPKNTHDSGRMIIEFEDYINSIEKGEYIDRLAVGIIDFEKGDHYTFGERKHFFDLASLTKPLVLGASFLKNPSLFDDKMKLLLEHRGGLPAWGILHRDNWQDHLESYSIKESSVEYSDYSALRLMLELESKLDISLQEYCNFYWEKELFYWRDQKGYKVHDPNAQNIPQFTSHAGLFATIDGLNLSLLELDKKTNFVDKVGSEKAKRIESRFILGWDSVTDLEQTLAGKGCHAETFGHLGFTGTSIWIDSIKKRGHIILTDVTKKYWYEKKDLNKLRREIGERVWSIDVLEQRRSI